MRRIRRRRGKVQDRPRIQRGSRGNDGRKVREGLWDRKWAACKDQFYRLRKERLAIGAGVVSVVV